MGISVDVAIKGNQFRCYGAGKKFVKEPSRPQFSLLPPEAPAGMTKGHPDGLKAIVLVFTV